MDTISQVIPSVTLKACRVCSLSKDESSYRLKKTHGKYYRARTCYKCEREKFKAWVSKTKETDPEHFTRQSRESAKRYRQNNPKSYVDNTLRYAYGIVQSDIDKLLLAQDGKCAICRISQELSRGAKLCVDHNHKTGKVRGLLCRDCNWAIGIFKDNLTSLSNAYDYIKRDRS